MLIISKRDIGHEAYCDENGKKCLLGHVFSAYGIPESLLKESPSGSILYNRITHPLVKKNLFRITGAGNYILNSDATYIVERNNAADYDEAAARLTDLGITTIIVP